MPRKQSLLANDSFTVAVIAGLVSQSLSETVGTVNNTNRVLPPVSVATRTVVIL